MTWKVRVVIFGISKYNKLCKKLSVSGIREED